MGTLVVGLARFARRSLAVVLCALAAHAAAYGSFLPHDAVHGYVGMYETIVGGLSAVALGLVAATLGALLIGKGDRLQRLIGLPTRRVSFVRSVVVIAASALAVLILQERLERVVANAPGSQGSSGSWAVAIVAIVLASVVLVVLSYSYHGLVRALLRGKSGLPRALRSSGAPARSVRGHRRRNSLADFRGMRAPPVALG
jgi:hypothetical protein